MLVENVCLLAVIFFILNFSQSWFSQPVHELLVTEFAGNCNCKQSFTSDHAIYCCASHCFVQITFTPSVDLEAFRVRSWILRYLFPDLWNLLLRRTAVMNGKILAVVSDSLHYSNLYQVKNDSKEPKKHHIAQVWKPLRSALDYFQKQKTVDFFHQPLPRLERNCSKASMLFLNFG